jgi:hypothetical protein
MGGTVGDDVILDAVIDVAWKDAAFQQVLFGAVGAEADDARGPGGREAGNFGQLVSGGAVDIDAVGRRRGRFGVRLLKPGVRSRLHGERRAKNYSQQQKSCGVSHDSILDQCLYSRKAAARNAGMGDAQRSRLFSLAREKGL